MSKTENFKNKIIVFEPEPEVFIAIYPELGWFGFGDTEEGAVESIEYICEKPEFYAEFDEGTEPDEYDTIVPATGAVELIGYHYIEDDVVASLANDWLFTGHGETEQEARDELLFTVNNIEALLEFQYGSDDTEIVGTYEFVGDGDE